MLIKPYRTALGLTHKLQLVMRRSKRNLPENQSRGTLRRQSHLEKSSSQHRNGCSEPRGGYPRWKLCIRALSVISCDMIDLITVVALGI